MKKEEYHKFADKLNKKMKKEISPPSRSERRDDSAEPSGESCECGHEKEEHRAFGDSCGCLVKKCPCEKFKAKMVGVSISPGKYIIDNEGTTMEIKKPQNHSPLVHKLEDKEPADVNVSNDVNLVSSGSDNQSLSHKIKELCKIYEVPEEVWKMIEDYEKKVVKKLKENYFTRLKDLIKEPSGQINCADAMTVWETEIDKIFGKGLT